MWPFNKTGPSGFSPSATAEQVTEEIDGSGLTAFVKGIDPPFPSSKTFLLAVC